MAYINKKDTDGVKSLLKEGELGYDKYPAGGDVGRVYVGTGTSNLPLAQKSETDAAAGRLDIIEPKLATIEPNAKDDQIASEVPVNPVGGIVSTDVQAALAELDSEKFNKTGGTITGDVTISANLTVSGTTTQVNSEVTTTDRVITVNDGEVGAGVTNGFAGMEVDRGTLPSYEFGFSETSGTFELGETGSRQAVATREFIPIDQGVMQWNDALSRIDAILPEINDTLVPTGDTEALNNLLGYIANRLKALSGEADWKADPDIALSEVKAYSDSTAAVMAIALG